MTVVIGENAEIPVMIKMAHSAVVRAMAPQGVRRPRKEAAQPERQNSLLRHAEQKTRHHDDVDERAVASANRAMRENRRGGIRMLPSLITSSKGASEFASWSVGTTTEATMVTAR